jgi:hypothetical protein
VFVLGCDGDTTETRGGARVRYSYVITPAGSLYRVFGAGPITRGANTTVGLQIAYLARSNDAAQLDHEADELIQTFGPELLLTPERTLKLEARLRAGEKGFRPAGRTLLFERKDDRWLRAAQQPAAPVQPRAAGAANAPDESSFPFERAKVDAAAAEAARWLDLLDRHSPASVEPLSPEFARKLAASPEYLPNLLANRRSFGLPAPRRELYRMQSSDHDPMLGPGDNVMVQYLVTPPGAAPVLERITMHRKRGRWNVAGYLVQPIAPQP